MSAVSGGGNYISDAAIMEWLALQQDGIYADLKESMDLAETRAQFNDALTTIKAQLADANEQKDFAKVDGELQALMDEYASNPEFAETCAALADMANKIHGDYENVKDYEVKYAQYEKDLAVYNAKVADMSPADLRNSAVKLHKPEAPPQPVRSYPKDSIEKWTKLIDDKVETSGKNDQLTMIHIQELKATLDQGSQLASTFISSGDKTSSAIIGNIA